jgi:DNA invertase Pin-like site-specific DNA recombinase
MGSGDKVVGYARVSTDEQRANGVSLDAQRQAIEEECRRRGWELLRIDQDTLSGKTTKRPGLQLALDACRSGEASGIVVMKLDRLTRSIIDFGRLLEEALDRRQGFNIVALDLGVDLSTPGGELVGNVMASVAQWERRAIGQRTKDALAVKRAQGIQLGRPRTMPASVRRRIQRERDKGRSLSEIARRLNEAGIPTAHGGARWHASTVRAVLVGHGPT